MADLTDGRSDPDTRDVLRDWRIERGLPEERLGVMLDLADADAADTAAANADAPDAPAAAAAAAAADAADAADTADADTNADAPANADAAAHAAANADADAADAAANADAAAAALTQLLRGEPDMTDGLKIIQLPGTYYYTPTFVGWLRRIGGDEWELCAGARVILRTGNMMPGGLDRLAEGPPKKGYHFGDPSTRPQEIHRLLVRSSRAADVEAWAKLVARPKDWVERT